MTGIEKLRDLARNMRLVGYAWAEDLADDLDSIAGQIERPDIKLLDADGVEIRPGDVLYLVEASECVTVMSVYGRCSFVDQNGSHRTARYFTHRAPVLAADGKPLREGETVYHIADGRACVVREVREGGAVVEPVDGRPCGRCRADYLTHERPDSWERLEEDAANLDEMPCDYNAKDLVRRAKALAGGA